MSDYFSKLRSIQQQVQEVDEKRAELHSQRAKLILEARAAGKTNRAVAKAMGVPEQQTYRFTRGYR